MERLYRLVSGKDGFAFEEYQVIGESLKRIYYLDKIGCSGDSFELDENPSVPAEEESREGLYKSKKEAVDGYVEKLKSSISALEQEIIEVNKIMRGL